MSQDPYSSIPGWAVIVEFRQPDPHAYSRSDCVEVLFDFTPDDLDAPARYRFPEGSDARQRLEVGSGADPSRSWVTGKGLLPGTRHRCRRRELLRGVGPPVLFEFPELDDRGGSPPAE